MAWVLVKGRISDRHIDTNMGISHLSGTQQGTGVGGGGEEDSNGPDTGPTPQVPLMANNTSQMSLCRGLTWDLVKMQIFIQKLHF